MKILHPIGCLAAFALAAWADEAKPSAAPTAPAPAVMPLMPPPGGPLPPGPAGAPGGPKGAPSQQFSEDFMKLVMEASAKIEEAKRLIQERQAHLIETDPAIQKLQASLMDMQKQINAIVEADPEYAQLKLKRDILATVMPDLPKPPGGPMNGPMGGPMGGRPMMPPPSMRLPPGPAAPAQP